MKDFMLFLSDNNQADVIEAFNSTSRYLDDLLNCESMFFKRLSFGSKEYTKELIVQSVQIFWVRQVSFGHLSIVSDI